MVKKYISIVLVSIFCLMILASCGGGGGSYSETTDQESTSFAAGESFSANKADGVASVDSNYEEDFSNDEEVTQEKSTDNTTAVSVPQQDFSNAKLIYSGDLSMDTKDYSKTVSQIKNLAAKYNAFIGQANEYDNGYNDFDSPESSRELHLMLYIPSENFSKFFDEVGDIEGYVKSKNQSVDDVTKQYNDNKLRLESLRTQEGRLLEIMKNANTISEMLEIENRLNTIRTDISMIENENSGIDFRAQYSTISVSINEISVRTSVGQTFGERFGETVNSSMHNFVKVVQGLVLIVVTLLPYIIVVAVILLIVYFCNKNSKKKNATRAQEQMRGQKLQGMPKKPNRSDSDHSSQLETKSNSEDNEK